MNNLTKESKMRKITLSLLTVAAMSACAITPKSLETGEQDVLTEYGVVRCQLYSPEIVVWDRSVDRPEGTSHVWADRVCEDEGRRILNGTDGGVYVLQEVRR